MKDSVPNSRRNLDIAIGKIQQETTNPIQVRTIMASTIVGQILPDGAVKGGSALKLRYGDKATRFTRDLDTARAIDLDEFITKLDLRLKEGWQGFSGRIVRKDPAKPKNVPGEYIMQPFEIKLDYKGKSWVTVPLEIGHDEIGDTISPDYLISDDIVSIFKKLGFMPPKPIALVSIPHQIAQKLHALSTAGSQRAHDLIDLQIIVQNETIDYAAANEACVRLFRSRRMQSWPPEISVGDGWSELYDAQRFELPVMQTVEEAVSWVNELVQRINSVKSI